MAQYKTIQEAGYKFLWHTKGELALLNEFGVIEFFGPSKNFAGFAINWRGTQWEFMRSYSEGEKLQFVNGIKRILNFGEQHPGFLKAYKLNKKLK